jgi:hypothetical protein
MYGYRDMTFCYDPCGNKDCHRNACHVPSGVVASWSFMKDSEYCRGWKHICDGAEVSCEEDER